jgi:hypothetical protein
MISRLKTSFSNRLILSFIGMTFAVLGFVNCAKKTTEETPQNNTVSKISAWDAPVGAPIDGVTLADGWQDLRESPAPVNILGGWTDSAHIAASGESLYFAYSKVDAWQFIHSNGATKVFSGSARSGMIGDEFRIFRADLSANGWNIVYHPVNASNTNFAEASMSTNEAEDLMIFTRWSVIPPNDGNLYYSTKTNDTWSTALAFPLNSACEDDNAFVVGSMNTEVTIYFESERGNDAGTVCGGPKRIYKTTFTSANGGSFSPVQQVPGLNGTNSGDSDNQIFVTLDQTKAYWTAVRASPSLYGVVTADLVNGSFTNMHPLAYPNNYAPPFAGKLVWIGEANVAEVPEGSLLYMMCGVAQGDSGGQPDNVQLKLCRARKPK